MHEDDEKDENIRGIMIGTAISRESIMSKLSPETREEVEKAMSKVDTPNPFSALSNISETARKEYISVLEIIKHAVLTKIQENPSAYGNMVSIDFTDRGNELSNAVEELVETMIEAREEMGDDFTIGNGETTGIPFDLADLIKTIEINFSKSADDYNIPFPDILIQMGDVFEDTKKVYENSDEDTANKIRLLTTSFITKIKGILSKENYGSVAYGVESLEVRKTADSEPVIANVVNVAICSLGLIVSITDAFKDDINIRINGDPTSSYDSLTWEEASKLIKFIQNASKHAH